MIHIVDGWEACQAAFMSQEDVPTDAINKEGFDETLDGCQHGQAIGEVI